MRTRHGSLTANLEGLLKVSHGTFVRCAQQRKSGGAPKTRSLGETCYTQVLLRHGGYTAKISVAPVSANLTEFAGSKVETFQRFDALRDQPLAERRLVRGPARTASCAVELAQRERRLEQALTSGARDRCGVKIRQSRSRDGITVKGSAARRPMLPI